MIFRGVGANHRRYGPVTKRTKTAIRDEAKASAKLNKELNAAHRKRRKAYEERKKKRREQVECEPSDYGADDDDWVDDRGDSPHPPHKTMKELPNEHRSKLHPKEVVQTFKPAKPVARNITAKSRTSIKSTARSYKSHQLATVASSSLTSMR